jgi:uncharacterized membrane protein YccC
VAGALSTKTKEAIKTALAFALAYGIALKTGWMSPMWAGLTVAVVAMPSAGQSLQKGLLRLAGTVPGCTAALVIFALAPQSRWLALAFTCAWMFFTTYMMLSRPTKSYLWNVAGFTALIIMTGSFESSADIFDRAQSRTMATIVGIILYTLVTTFLWPQSNEGAIRKALEALLSTQRERFRALRQRAIQSDEEQNLRELHTREVQQLTGFEQALQAEGSESYRVREIRPALEHLRDLSSWIMECFDRLETMAPTGGLLSACVPNLDALLDEIDARFSSISPLPSADSALRPPAEVAFALDREALNQLPALDRAAVVVAKGRLESLDALTREAVRQVQELLSNRSAVRSRGGQIAQRSQAGYDLDHLRGAMLVAATVAAGFLLWVFVNPPGHASWLVFPGVIAMMVAGTQQLTAKVFIRPTAIALALGIAIYVFVLPKLSTFAELGIVLFATMFVVNYSFKGIGKFAGMVGVLMGISVQHQQAYSFAAMANTYVFVLSSFILVYAMSYMIQSPRPEKALLWLVQRFFRSARFLVASTSNEATGPFERWRVAWHRRELQRLPSKITAWSKAINRKAFPANTPERVDDLVVGLRAMAYRIDELLDSRAALSTPSLAFTLADDIRSWRVRLESALADWARRPESPAAEALRDDSSEWRRALEQRIDAASQDERAEKVDDAEWRRFYTLLGSYRGVSASILSYGECAGQIDWAAWREERFS